jgi:hypothetical protein
MTRIKSKRKISKKKRTSTKKRVSAKEKRVSAKEKRSSQKNLTPRVLGTAGPQYYLIHSTPIIYFVDIFKKWQLTPNSKNKNVHNGHGVYTKRNNFVYFSVTDNPDKYINEQCMTLAFPIDILTKYDFYVSFGWDKNPDKVTSGYPKYKVSKNASIETINSYIEALFDHAQESLKRGTHPMFDIGKPTDRLFSQIAIKGSVSLKLLSKIIYHKELFPSEINYINKYFPHIEIISKKNAKGKLIKVNKKDKLLDCVAIDDTYNAQIAAPATKGKPLDPK